MNISVICACKNRANALKVSLASWLLCDQIKEIIIVDWNSDEPINYLTKLDKRIKIVRVENEDYFNQPQPLNLALSMTTGDYILKLDTDYIINPYKEFFKNYIPSESSFVSGNQKHESPEFIDPKTGHSMIDMTNMTIQEIAEYVNTYSHFYKFLTGMLFVSKEHLLNVGGYNESFTKYYAFEDDEICQRLELYGLDHIKLKYDYNMIHIPHSDHKRFENFKGFIESESNEKLRNLPDCEYKWQTEYWIAQTHIDNNKKICSGVKEYYVKPRTKWDITNIDDQNYFATKLIDDKLEGFPSAYYVSLEESQERRDNLESQFAFYGINPKGIVSKRFSECDDVVYGKYLQSLNEGTTGCVISHLKAIKEWYDTTNEEYGFFCEDDLSLETVDYWDFTWEEFIDRIPEDADCVQMFAIRGEYDTFDLRERYWDDWGASAYIITREYAKRLIDTFIRDDGYCLEIPNQTSMPLIENILFASLGKCYTIPLFVEEVKFQSTFVGKDDDVKDGQKKNHYVSHQKVLEWWKGKNVSEDDRISIASKQILTLSDLFKSGNYNTDKDDLGYLDNFYDDFFIKLKESPITMMEIGVYHGGSIKLWKDYLHSESKIYAGDINYFDHLEGTYSVIGDMYSDQQVSKFPNEYFDLIIDDGPHSFESFVLLIQKYLPKIKKGGTLIVEDVIYTEWVEPLVKMVELIGYSNVEVIDMSGKQKTQELFDRWKGGLYILNITK